MMKFQQLCITLASLLPHASGFLPFQTHIPNGDHVPNPCNVSTIWPGVGHKNPPGGGERNPFGLDFKRNNLTWTLELCQQDSDGDGRTNGQELGDPNCTWTPGQTPASNKDLTHPGVCEPLSSSNCAERNSWLTDCRTPELNCSAINDTGVRNISIRIPYTNVPVNETTYFCRKFLLPSDTDYNIIAVKPWIDNVDVLHHILLFLCSSIVRHPVDESFRCGLIDEVGCKTVMGIWSPGNPGQCYQSETAFRIGPTGFQYAMLELHWNNPRHRTDFFDTSGMTVYYTAALRRNRLQVMLSGQEYLEIPPNRQEVTQGGSCPSVCTQQFPQSIFITSIFIHMHTLGKDGDITQYRDGSLVQVLDRVDQYNFDSPVIFDYNPPKEVKPGDEIRVRCNYQSTKTNTTTYYGEATSSEMCFAIITYYPALPSSYYYCGQWKSINLCGNDIDVVVQSCDFSVFMGLINELLDGCSGDCGTTHCGNLMNAIYRTNCHRNSDVNDYLSTFLPKIDSVLMGCEQVHPLSRETTSHSSRQSFSYNASVLWAFVLLMKAQFF